MFISKPPIPSSPNIDHLDDEKQRLIKAMLANNITEADLVNLRKMVDADDLAIIIQRIYDLNEKYILKISAVDGLLRKLDDIKNIRRNKRFTNKIKDGFRNSTHTKRKVILAEGDSWFNYPIILTDIIDRISMEDNFAVYSLASGGDWLLNMLTGRHYVEQLSVLHPDVFLISGGGNDLVGSSRLATMLDPSGNSTELGKNEWAQNLITKANAIVDFDPARFWDGIRHVSRDFFALLMFFHLQYYSLIEGIVKNALKPDDKFYPIQIITQGYDYGVPSYKNGLGSNPGLWFVPFIRSFLGHGHWLKTPMQIRGILNEDVQKNIIYAMIYLFNEMMIGIGRYFNSVRSGSVSHIDSRGTVGNGGWTDELHPKPVHFMKTAKVFIGCINRTIEPDYEHVYIVTKPVL